MTKELYVNYINDNYNTSEKLSQLKNDILDENPIPDEIVTLIDVYGREEVIGHIEDLVMLYVYSVGYEKLKGSDLDV